MGERKNVITQRLKKKGKRMPAFAPSVWRGKRKKGPRRFSSKGSRLPPSPPKKLGEKKKDFSVFVIGKEEKREKKKKRIVAGPCAKK